MSGRRNGRALESSLTPRAARRVLPDLMPFCLEKRRYLSDVEVSNGARSNFVHAYIDGGPHDEQTVVLAVRKCCVHFLVRHGMEEVLHGLGLLEKDLHPTGDPDKSEILDAVQCRSTFSREVAYALLASLLGLPTYCPLHRHDWRSVQ